MKFNLLKLFLVGFITITYSQNNEDALVNVTSKNQSARITKNFNKEWKFQLSDSIAYNAIDFDDSEWRILDVPHDWSIEFDYNESNSGRNAWLPGGVGWYRKTIIIPKEQSNKEFKIEFDGVYKNATLWVNDHYVGNQHDGYTSFYYNITPFINFGGKNTFALKVDNSIQPNCRWYSGSGVYRSVRLTITNKLAIEQWGTFITTPKVLSNQAEVLIQTTLRNYANASNLILETTIYNADGEQVGIVRTNAFIDRKTSKTVNQTINIENPILWSTENPELYISKSKVIVNNKTVDNYETTFGIRTIDFDAKKGFFLNGENLKLKGVCLHNDGGILGTAVPIEIWKRRLDNLKEIGCNAIRAAHNPPSPEFLDLCDTMGFLVMNEFVDKWNADKTNEKKGKGLNNFFNPNGFGDPYFEFEWQKNYKSTVLRDRNHPSVIMWSVGNENYPPEAEEQVQGLRKYTSYVRSLDSTRPVVSGMERGRDIPVNDKIDAIINTCSEMDLIALNYGEQWCKEIGKRNLEMPYVSTESYRYFNSSPEKRFANIERSPWIDVLENDHNIGLFLWVGIDYLGESKKYPKLGSTSGLLDIAGFKKTESYLYQAFWSEKPMVSIAVYEGDANDFSTSGRWGWPPIYEAWNFKKGEKKDLVTYTNCESVNLYLNNKLIGNKKLSDFPNWIMKWQDTAFEEGTLKAVGIINGKEVCEFELKTTGEPYKINLKPYNKHINSGDIVQIEVSILDKKNVLVTHQPVDLYFKIEGDAEILGLSNGDMYDDTSASNIETRKTKQGACLVILKMGQVMDGAKLTVTSKDLKKGVLNLK
ncbi:glycoside hydrolase family 2 TIM barrel-domain containing protein [Flavivirga algicola]|uniref:Glycoside hydrolase family 2 protein n=1 Tax=Flavivirga algicola TaxID=2729136 RepID=A0ABX1RTB8_9FLAO|nr:glycoside hydrolase family 2 TIM barrel-domain containing protein [Flavivirga algicola]NMH86802.1 glycoside hydrolase family 2 protein [Flavivirga algicola]